MTEKEAIEILTNIKNTPQITWTNGADIAIDLAINALEIARPQGEWIDYDNTFYKCPDCGYLLEKCCPQCQTKIILPICHCGADMRGKNNESSNNI